MTGENVLASIYALLNIENNPYQIAAAQYALRTSFLKGCIFCDEGSLGKGQ